MDIKLTYAITNIPVSGSILTKEGTKLEINLTELSKFMKKHYPETTEYSPHGTPTDPESIIRYGPRGILKGKYNAAIIHLNTNPSKITALIFKSGKFILVGAKSFKQIDDSIQLLSKMLKDSNALISK
jgi:hypothetical protein